MPLGPMNTKAQKREGVRQVMHEFKAGDLHSGSKTGPVVKNRKQAIAIAMSQTGQSKAMKGRWLGGPIGYQEGGRATYLNLDPRVREYARRKGVDPEDLTADDVRHVANQIGSDMPAFRAMDRINRARREAYGMPSDEGYQEGGSVDRLSDYESSNIEDRRDEPRYVPNRYEMQVWEPVASGAAQIVDPLRRGYWKMRGEPVREVDPDIERSVLEKQMELKSRGQPAYKPRNLRTGESSRFARGGSLGLPNIGRPAFSPSFGQGLRGPSKIKFKTFKGFKRMDQGGLIDSEVPGRTDKHNVLVPSGSYVLPADHVSALGENNTIAGAEAVKKMFGPGTKFGARLAVPRFAEGGGVGEPVPVVVAGGEVILPPQVVRRIGNGDVEKGHSILDRWVLDTRKKHVQKLKSLKPPKGADE